MGYMGHIGSFEFVYLVGCSGLVYLVDLYLQLLVEEDQQLWEVHHLMGCWIVQVELQSVLGN